MKTIGITRTTFLLSVVCLLLIMDAKAEPGWDGWGTHFAAGELLDKGDFRGLESLAMEIKGKGYTIEQQFPGLAALYGGLKLGDGFPQNVWLDRLKALKKWRAAYPDSLTAKIAEVNWYLEYSDQGYELPPPEEGPLRDPGEWAPEKTNLDKAAELLKSVPMDKVDDPEYYVDWLKVCCEQGKSKDETYWYMNKGTDLAKEYVPIYTTMAHYLLPNVKGYGEHGKPKELEEAIKEWADRFPGDKGDILYAYLLSTDAGYYGADFFKIPNADYGRAKKGYSLRLSGNDPEKWWDENSLAYLAGSKGDKKTAKKMLLDLEGSADIDRFFSQKTYEHFRDISGARGEIEAALGLEKEGKLAEAEAKLLSFTSDPSIYLPLVSFYERQGMKEKLLGMKMKFVGKTVKEMSEIDPRSAPADLLGEMASYYPMMGDWKNGEIAAARFDQLRPENLIGKNMLLLGAINRGDAEAAEKTIMAIASMRTDKRPYLIAQSVLRGEKKWDDVVKSMKKSNEYTGQGTTAIALYYLAKGENEMASRVIEEMLPHCAENSGKSLLESLQFGSLSRSLKPVALLPSAEAATGTTLTNPTLPNNTGTN